MPTHHDTELLASEGAAAHIATPLLFVLSEKIFEVPGLDITHTGGPTDVPPREIWDEDYDAP